tara:strand:+ start:1228 stop:1590 length:363 start_codon:yes stop_codon:yes gene_type:complete
MYCKNNFKKSILCEVKTCKDCLRISEKKEVSRNLVNFYRKGLKTNDLNELRNYINGIVSIHKKWLNTVKKEVKTKNFSNVGCVDWNEFYHDYEDTIEKAYINLKNKMHDLHFEKFGFNAY